MADQPKPPLWRVMCDVEVPGGQASFTPRMFAAEIRALADWLVPEQKAPLLMSGPDLARHAERQWIRSILLAEADRAEASDG